MSRAPTHIEHILAHQKLLNQIEKNRAKAAVAFRKKTYQREKARVGYISKQLGLRSPAARRFVARVLMESLKFEETSAWKRLS